MGQVKQLVIGRMTVGTVVLLLGSVHMPKVSLRVSSSSVDRTPCWLAVADVAHYMENVSRSIPEGGLRNLKW